MMTDPVRFSFKSFILAAMLSLSACQVECHNSAQGCSIPIKPLETSALDEFSLPRTVSGLQNLIIKMEAQNSAEILDRAINVYVFHIKDRRAQRDFVNNLWKGENGITQNRELALRIAIKLSDAYDLSAPTYLAGFSYWYPTAGAEQNFDNVIKYWTRASQSANATVQYRLASIYMSKTSGHHDTVRGRALMDFAANAGNVEARQWLEKSGNSD